MSVLHSDKILDLGKPSDFSNSENTQKYQAILYETNFGFFYEHYNTLEPLGKAYVSFKSG